MRIRPVLLLLVGAVVLIAPSGAGAQAPATTPAVAPRPKPAQLPSDSLLRAQNFIVWMYSAQSDSMWAHLGAEAQKEMGTAKALEGVSLDLAARAGVEEQVIGERWVTRNGKRQYWRTAKFSNSPDPLLIRLVMTSAGDIPGWGMGSAGSPPPIDP